MAFLDKFWKNHTILFWLQLQAEKLVVLVAIKQGYSRSQRTKIWTYIGLPCVLSMYAMYLGLCMYLHNNNYVITLEEEYTQTVSETLKQATY